MTDPTPDPTPDPIPRALTATLRPLHHLTANLPDPEALRWSLRSQLEDAYQAAVELRGQAHTPEDTYDIQRALAAATDHLKAYGSVFYQLRQYVGQLVEEQMIDAVGEQTRMASAVGIDGEPEYSGTGTPNQGLRIPDGAGDVVLSLDNTTSYTFDLDQILAVLVGIAVADLGALIWPDRLVEPDMYGKLAELIEGTLRDLLDLGKFDAQVSKVKARAAKLARAGDDQAASVLNGTIRKKTIYKGIKYERK